MTFSIRKSMGFRLSMVEEEWYVGTTTTSGVTALIQAFPVQEINMAGLTARSQKQSAGIRSGDKPKGDCVG